MTNKRASITMVMDVSGSMAGISTDSVNSNLQLLQTDTNTFMSIMQNTGNADNFLGKVGLVSFSDNASIIYALTQLDASGSVLGNAIGKVQGLSASGQTNITDAVSKGTATLAGVDRSTHNPAMVLYSDGAWNRGGDPIPSLPTASPIFCIGYGSYAQLSYLKTIATKTNAKYHITGDPGVLATFYHDIIHETKVAHTLKSVGADVPMYGLFQTTAVVSASEGWHVFVATWADDTLNYSAGTPGPGQIQVLLHNPLGKMVSADIVDAPAGRGYAILTVNKPMAGSWAITTHPATLNHGLTAMGAAHGVFKAPISVTANMMHISTGSTLQLAAHVSDNGQNLQDVKIMAHAVRPLYSDEENIKRHADDLKRIQDENDFHEDENPTYSALRLLNKQRPELNLFQQIRQPANIVGQDKDGYVIEVDNPKPDVPHTVYATFEGHSPTSGEIFQVTRLLTVDPTN